MATHTQAKTINIVIAALGGQGGGVLLDWITQVARKAGWASQATSVPGVAQRTGATIYYLEVFPHTSAAATPSPVMSLFPMPNNVDVVLASEIVEAGRMLQRGFVTPSRTTLIASTHRVYAIGERAAVKDEVIDANALRAIATDQANKLVMLDLDALAVAHGTVISATLFGAFAGSGALPAPQEHYEAVIKEAGIQVGNNLNAFRAAYGQATKVDDAATVHQFEPPQPGAFEIPDASNDQATAIVERLRALPGPVQEVTYHGARKLADYLDYAYANEYLDAVERCLQQDKAEDFTLTQAFAKRLALWLSFEDIIRVAHLKIKKSRQAELRREVRANPEQVVEVRDFFKPRVEEICGVLPHTLGKWVEGSKLMTGLIGRFTKGRQLASTHVSVFLMLRVLASLRRIRRMTHAHVSEQRRIATWQTAVFATTNDHAKALALVESAKLVKGYGATRARGCAQVDQICQHATEASARDINAWVAAGLEDDQGTAFELTFGKGAGRAA